MNYFVFVLHIYDSDLNTNFRDHYGSLGELIRRGSVDRRVFFGEVRIFGTLFLRNAYVYVYLRVCVSYFNLILMFRGLFIASNMFVHSR